MTPPRSGGDQAAAHRQLLAHIHDRAKFLGLAVYHNPDSIRADAGFPDLVIVGTRVLFREVKTGTGRLSPTQTWWRYMIHAARGDYRVWNQADWDTDQIDRELLAIRPDGVISSVGGGR